MATDISHKHLYSILSELVGLKILLRISLADSVSKEAAKLRSSIVLRAADSMDAMDNLVDIVPIP